MQDRLNRAAEQKQHTRNGELLPVMEQFYTIQGEGFHTGKAAFFIRVGGCDVGCHWCDVKESWDASVFSLSPVSLIADNALAFPAQTIVVTGGEPTLYPLDILTGVLKKNNFQTHIETSGAYPLSGTWDWICLSPKKTMPPLSEIYKQANELKVIVYNKHDFEWAEQQASMVKDNCLLYLQPEWSRSEKLMDDITSFVMQNPKWMVSLQTHKYMKIP